MKFAFALIAIFLGTSTAALAQEAICNQNQSWLAIAQDQTDYAGMQILVRPAARGKIKCEYAEGPDDFVVNPDGDPLWFEALLGDYLAAFRSTGPDGNIVIFDIATRAVVVDVPADSDVLTDETSVTYWERTIVGTAENCPEFAEYTGNGLGAVIAEERVFDGMTGEISATGETRCSATQ